MTFKQPSLPAEAGDGSERSPSQEPPHNPHHADSLPASADDHFHGSAGQWVDHHHAEPASTKGRLGGHGHHHGPLHSGHHQHHHVGQASKKALFLAFLLTSSFMFLELVVGYWSGSLALLADAAHMLADSAALGLALLAQHFANRPHTVTSTFGFRRLEVLAAFINGILLAVLAVGITIEALERWFEPHPIDAMPMLLTAMLGFGVNLLAAFILMRAQKESLNVRAAFAHVLADALGSVAAILAGILVLAFGLYRADSVLSVVIALMVAYSGWRVLRETTGILLEGAPPHLQIPQIAASMLEVPGVREVHDLHVWRISDRFDVLTAHVTLERGAHGTDVCRSVARQVKATFGIHHVTVQPEAPPPEPVVLVRSSRDGAPIIKS